MLLLRSLVLILSLCSIGNKAFSPKGSAKTPLDKKKIVVIGSGGYLGAITFGFLQRAGSLYGTGISPKCRCIGATSATSLALNTILGKNFCLAQADESFVKLTNLESVEAIRQRLEGYDAVIVGNEMVVEIRPVTAGTYEKTPNDKTMEVFWDLYRGKSMTSEVGPQAETIIDNVLQACKDEGIQHIVGVATRHTNNPLDNFLKQVKGCGVPYTLLQCPGELTRLQDYTYRKGVQGNLVVEPANGDTTDLTSSASIYREDIAAISLQCLKSLDWNKCRHLVVNSNGPLPPNEASLKRLDQEWVVNSHALERNLASID